MTLIQRFYRLIVPDFRIVFDWGDVPMPERAPNERR